MGFNSGFKVLIEPIEQSVYGELLKLSMEKTSL